MLAELAEGLRSAYGLLRMTCAEVIAVTLQSLRPRYCSATSLYTREALERGEAFTGGGRGTAPQFCVRSSSHRTVPCPVAVGLLDQPPLVIVGILYHIVVTRFPGGWAPPGGDGIDSISELLKHYFLDLSILIIPQIHISKYTHERTNCISRGIRSNPIKVRV